MKKRYRVEKDYLGSKKIAADAYYGISTQRAIENFPISGLHFQHSLIDALVTIKKAAAHVNAKDGRIPAKKAKAIVKACDEILHRKLDNQFILDVYQAGAGTSEHMNVNEVIANRALEILGEKKGRYNIINPHDHVNLAQSTNDVFHSAIHIAAYSGILDLLSVIEHLHKALHRKARAWKSVLKIGRTHLRDAVPMTLGQEFGGYAQTIKNDHDNIKDAARRLLELNLGGTAIGTKATASKKFGKDVILRIAKETKTQFKQSPNLFEGTQSLAALLVVSSALRTFASNLIKILNDLRLLSSGPSSGLNEIRLPAVQPGSSIMPAKVNPSIVEMMEMVALQVLGDDTVIARAAQQGELELNVMMPIVAYDLLHAIEILSHGLEVFTHKCVEGIEPNKEVCLRYLEKNPIVVTLLTPHIGYEKAARIAKQAYKENKSIRDIVINQRIMNKNEFDNLFSQKKIGALA